MPRNSTQQVCLKGLAALVLCAAAAGASAAEPQLVLFYNAAQAPAEVVAQAQMTAARIFREAGIELRWRNCNPESSPCGDYLSGRSIILQLVGTAGAFPDKGSLGWAAVGPEGGVRAVVFYERVRQFTPAGSGPCTLSQVLGHAMAHEIGHLLLSLVGHSASGIMSSQWGTKQLRYVAAGELLFVPAEAARMREEAKRRGEAGVTLQAAAGLGRPEGLAQAEARPTR